MPIVMTETCAYETKYLDQDNRRRPKTDLYCIKCHKDIKPGQSHRLVHLVDGGPYVLHPRDEQHYVPDRADMGFFEIGGDCARQLGLEWTHKPIEGGE